MKTFNQYITEAYKDFFWGFLSRDYATSHKIIEGKPNDEATTHDGLAKRMGYGHESEEAERDGYVRFLMPVEGGTLVMSGYYDRNVIRNMAEFVKHDHRIIGPVEVELPSLTRFRERFLKYPDSKRAHLVLSGMALKAPEIIE